MKGCLAMTNVQSLNYQGKKIIYIDFSNCQPKDASEIMEHAKAVISQEPPNSLLTLTNVTNLRFDIELSQQFKAYTEFNKPYVKAAAIIGAAGLLKSGFQFVAHFAKRDIRAFDTKDEALDWLVNQ